MGQRLAKLRTLVTAPPRLGPPVARTEPHRCPCAPPRWRWFPPGGSRWSAAGKFPVLCPWAGCVPSLCSRNPWCSCTVEDRKALVSRSGGSGVGNPKCSKSRIGPNKKSVWSRKKFKALHKAYNISLFHKSLLTEMLKINTYCAHFAALKNVKDICPPTETILKQKYINFLNGHRKPRGGAKDSNVALEPRFTDPLVRYYMATQVNRVRHREGLTWRSILAAGAFWWAPGWSPATTRNWRAFLECSPGRGGMEDTCCHASLRVQMGPKTRPTLANFDHDTWYSLQEACWPAEP